LSLIALVQEKLKHHPNRFNHILGVKERALELQAIYGGDAFALETAAILHDLFKYDSISEQTQWIKDEQEVLKYQSVPVAYHAIAAAYYAKDALKIDDPIVFEAIYYHIWGKVGMRLETMIICVADFCEKNRTFHGAKTVYELSKKDLQQAFILSLEYTIEYLNEGGLTPFYEQLDVLKYYKETAWNY
jgi:predicted HD superfamily hydrolase involved in NAD metabolism